MLLPFQTLLRHRRLLAATTVSEIRSRYAGTVMGLAWTVIYPFLFLGLYAVVYVLILKVRLGETAPLDYVLLIFSGLVPFLGFSEALTTSVPSVIANKSLVKNTLFPLELVPVRAVLAACLTMVVGLGLLHMVLWARGHILYTQAFTLVIFITQIMFSVGLAWILSAVTVFFKDITHMIGVIVLFLMMASPIAYTNDMIPPAIMPFMYINPLYYMITLYRDAILGGVINWHLYGIFLALSLLFFFSGFWVFSRLKSVFADYV